jgi:hypothetical protein
VLRQRAMSDGIDAAVASVQPAALESPPDRASSEPQCLELPPGDDAVLPRRQLRDEGVRGSRLRLCTYAVLIRRVNPHRPSLARDSRRVALGLLRTCDAFAG